VTTPFTLRGLVGELAERGLKVDYRVVWAFVETVQNLVWGFFCQEDFVMGILVGMTKMPASRGVGLHPWA
jgi:hypothetical protein